MNPQRKELLESKLLTAPEAAAALRIGKSKLYAMLSSGEIPCIRIGKTCRIPQAAIDQLKDRSLVGGCS